MRRGSDEGGAASRTHSRLPRLRLSGLAGEKVGASGAGVWGLRHEGQPDMRRSVGETRKRDRGVPVDKRVSPCWR
jgi:hypothetical protein